MSTISSNLYPPIVPDVLPAFVGNSCVIYFSISPYNSIVDLKSDLLQVSIIDPNTNLSVVKSTTGIKLKNFNQDISSIKEDYNCYTTISVPDDFLDGTMTKNQFYKVQLRFTSSSCQSPKNNILTEQWLSENQSLFSEWSKVCLIRQIE